MYFDSKSNAKREFETILKKRLQKAEDLYEKMTQRFIALKSLVEEKLIYLTKMSDPRLTEVNKPLKTLSESLIARFINLQKTGGLTEGRELEEYIKEFLKIQCYSLDISNRYQFIVKSLVSPSYYEERDVFMDFSDIESSISKLNNLIPPAENLSA